MAFLSGSSKSQAWLRESIRRRESFRILQAIGAIEAKTDDLLASAGYFAIFYLADPSIEIQRFKLLKTLRLPLLGFRFLPLKALSDHGGGFSPLIAWLTGFEGGQPEA